MAFPQNSGIYRERGRKANGEFMNSYQKRQAWTKEEDEILKQQVSRLGTHCWPDVASGLPGRTSKACSLRWRCFLSPTIIRPNEEPFSQWEIAVIVLTQKMFGNKWNDIAAYLPMRCNNDIKNHFNLYLKDKHHQVALENSYLHQGYDLSSLLALEPDEVASRRERLEKDRAGSNNLDHGGVKSANRSAGFIRPRAPPTKPKPSPRFSPYHLAHLSESAAGQAVVTGIARSGSGPSLAGSADSDTASPSSQQTYSAFTAHSGHSMAALDAFALGGGFRTQPALAAAAAAAGLPASLMYGTSLSASYSPNASSLAGYMQGSCKQEAAVDANNMYGSYTGTYHVTGYAAMPVLSSSSGDSGSASPAAGASDEAVGRQPSRLAVAGHPGDTAGYVCAGQVDSSVSYGPGQYQLQQPILPLPQGQPQPRRQAADDPGSADQAGLPHFITVGSLEHMPSLPEPAEQGILEGGDGDGTSLRGIFSSDDGELHPPQQGRQQPAPLQLGIQRHYHHRQGHDVCLPGIDIAAAAAASGSQDGSPMGMHQMQQVSAASIPSPGSFTSSGASPLHQNFLPQSSNAAGMPGSGLQPQVQMGPGGVVRYGLYAEAHAAEGIRDSEAAVAATPCTVTAGYTASSYEHQQQQVQLMGVLQGAAAAGGQDVHNHEQQQQQVFAVLPEQQQLSTGRYTPFGHPQNQQQHMHHIYSIAGYQQHGQHQQPSQHVCEYQAHEPDAAMDGFDSGKSSHLNALHSPHSTMAQSAVAAVARLGTHAHHWRASQSSHGIKQELHVACKQHEQQQPTDVLQLLPRAPSVDLHEELGPLADLLGDNSGEGDEHGCDPALDDDLLAAAVHASGAYHEAHEDHHQHMADLDLLPGLARQNSELEMMATAACW